MSRPGSPGSQADNLALLIDIYTLTQEDPGKGLAHLGLVGFGKWQVRRYYYCTMRQLSESRSANVGGVC